MFMRIAFTMLLILACVAGFAQDAQPDSEDRPFTVDGAFVIDLSQKQDSIAAPKKKK